MDTTSDTETRVILRNYDGTLINPTISSSTYKLYFRGMNNVQQDSTFGATIALRQNVVLKCANIYGETGNFWVSGTMAV